MSVLLKLPIAMLELYTLLVYYGFKDAYLVDCCFMNQEQSEVFIVQLEHKYTLRPNILHIVLMGCDVFFVNHPLLVRKLSDVFEIARQPTVVNVGAEGLSIMAQSNILVQLQLLTDVFSSSLSNYPLNKLFDVPVTEELQTVVGLPYIAGWLLGYPCLYRAEQMEQLNVSGEDTSMLNLLKFSISATVSVHYLRSLPVKGKNTRTKPPAAVPQSIEILGFSIPEKLWTTHPELQTKLKDSVEEIRKEMQCCAERLAADSAKSVLHVSNITVEQQIHTVPKLAL